MMAACQTDLAARASFLRFCTFDLVTRYGKETDLLLPSVTSLDMMRSSRRGPIILIVFSKRFT